MGDKSRETARICLKVRILESSVFADFREFGRGKILFEKGKPLVVLASFRVRSLHSMPEMRLRLAKEMYSIPAIRSVERRALSSCWREARKRVRMRARSLSS